MTKPWDPVDKEVVAYRLKLVALGNRFTAGERSTVEREAQSCADDLICLMEEAPLGKRAKIDVLIDKFEALRAACLN
jgi:hypothetical protein